MTSPAERKLSAWAHYPDEQPGLPLELDSLVSRPEEPSPARALYEACSQGCSETAQKILSESHFSQSQLERALIYGAKHSRIVKLLIDRPEISDDCCGQAAEKAAKEGVKGFKVTAYIFEHRQFIETHWKDSVIDILDSTIRRATALRQQILRQPPR